MPQTPSKQPKQRRRNNILINILLVLCIVGVLAALGGLLFQHLRYRKAAGEYEALQEQFLPSLAPEESPAPAASEERTVDLAALRAINPDVVAWVELPGTQLSYPLVQGADNSQYLTQTVEGTYNPSGSIFMDYRNAPDFSQPNTLLYGHNMKDGSMFHVLDSYLGRSGSDFQKLYPTLYLYTDAGRQAYQILWVKETTVEDPVYTLSFGAEADSAAYVESLGQPGAHLLTLSTCENDYDDESAARLILQAVWVAE